MTSEGPIGTSEVAWSTTAAAPSALSPLSTQPDSAAPAPAALRAPRLKPKPGAAYPAAGGGARPQAAPAGQLTPMHRSRSAAVLQRGADPPELEAEVARALEEGLVSMADVHVYGTRTPWQGAHELARAQPPQATALPAAQACLSPFCRMFCVMSLACVAIMGAQWGNRYRTACAESSCDAPQCAPEEHGCAPAKRRVSGSD